MTEAEVIIALRNATPEQKEAVFAILRNVEPPKDIPETTRQLYEAAGEVLGTKVGFNTRHLDQQKARIFVAYAYRQRGYTYRQIAKLLGVDYQRITYYSRAAAEWKRFPVFSHELSQLEQFNDIVTKKHIL